MAPLIAGAISFVWSWRAPRSRLAAILTDDPSGDDLKVHERPIPPIGGIGIYLALLPAFTQLGDVVVWMAASAALVLGVLDDRLSLTPRLRLGLEFLIGALLAASPAIDSSWSIRVVVVGGTVVLINAINLYDGLDGLVGGAFVVSSVTVGFLAESVLAFALGAALIGFLVFNWHPARLFLGDGGAYLVAVAFVASAASGQAEDVAELLVLLAMAGVVLVDLSVTLIRRARTNAPLFRGDRSHVYDQLVDRDLGVRKVALISVLVQAAVVAVAASLLAVVGSMVAVVTVAAGLLGLVAVAVALGFTSASATGELS